MKENPVAAHGLFLKASKQTGAPPRPCLIRIISAFSDLFQTVYLRDFNLKKLTSSTTTTSTSTSTTTTTTTSTSTSTSTSTTTTTTTTTTSTSTSVICM